MEPVILLAVFVSSLPLLLAALLFWMWDQETPTLEREKIRIGDDEKIITHYHL
tara:strand:- start:302 stop:460 length:159 start_codon:yes stop_codon:yes gene_type:complete